MKKKILPFSAILSVLILSFLGWRKFRIAPKASVPEYIEPNLVTAIKKINKKIPKKLHKNKKIVQRPKLKKEKHIQIKKLIKEDNSFSDENISVHLQAPNGDLIITKVNIVDDYIIAHGDIIVGKIDDMEEFLEGARTGKLIVMPLAQPWDNGIIPYTIDSGLNNSSEIQAAIDSINHRTNVKWVIRKGQESFVRFIKGSLNCFSPLGKLGGEQSITLAEGCTKGPIMHEMIHSMGLLHEQNREDRDKFIQVLWENIDSKNHLQFQRISNTLINIEKYPFDFKSIMLYTQDAFSKYPGDQTIVRVDGNAYTPNKDTLSRGDLKKLSSLYPKKKN